MHPYDIVVAGDRSVSATHAKSDQARVMNLGWNLAAFELPSDDIAGRKPNDARPLEVDCLFVKRCG